MYTTRFEIPKPRLLRIVLSSIAIFIGTVASRAEALPDQSKLEQLDSDQLTQVIAMHKGHKAVLVNVWATWCAPCVKEFPDIVKLQKKYADELQVIFVSVDFPDVRADVIRFLAKQGVDWTTYIKHGKDEPFINALSEQWSGAIPATLVVDRSGNRTDFVEGAASQDEFERLIKRAIAPDKEQ